MIKRKDLDIIRHIRADSRVSLADISRKTKIPISTVFDKLSKFQNRFIEKNVTLLNFQELGYAIKVNYVIKCKDRDKLKDFLMQKNSVNNLYRINNGSDFFFEAIFRDMNEMEEFTEKLEEFGIERKDKFHVIEELKRESFLPENDKN
jgi:DNA-binding Lrp family transcriptional regulator